ncbi:MAG: hypothetical protein WBD48_02285, partial [Pseudolabrys sp.]
PDRAAGCLDRVERLVREYVLENVPHGPVLAGRSTIPARPCAPQQKAISRLSARLLKITTFNDLT